MSFNADKFYRYINSQRDKLFKLGVFDCFIFVSNYILLSSGKIYFDQFKGKYKTKKGWMGLIKREGYESLEDLLNKNFTKKNINLASRGDIVLLNGECLGLCDGAYSIFLDECDDYDYRHVATCKCDGVYGL